MFTKYIASIIPTFWIDSPQAIN